MSKARDRNNSFRVQSSNVTVVISIALVLFLLGLFGLIVINAQSYSDYIKEQLKIEAFFVDNLEEDNKDKTKESQLAFIDSLKSYEFVRSANYISKEQAAKIAKKELGVGDTDAIFEESIYPPSALISIKSKYVTPERLDSIVELVQKNPIVDSVQNDKEFVYTVYQKIGQITFWLIVLAVLFLLIVIVLINNSIRLKIYAKRFSIKTMQLVGARRRFIMRPFLVQGVLLGFFGALIALFVLGGAWYVFTNSIQRPFWDSNYIYLIIGLIFVGIFIAFLSTVFATWRYLKLRTNQLY